MSCILPSLDVIRAAQTSEPDDGPASAWAPLAIIIVSLAFWTIVGAIIWAGLFGEFIALSVIAAFVILAMSRGVV